MSAPPPPAAAHAVFAARLNVAVRFADLLCGAGVERGLIGPREPDRIWERHLLSSAVLGEAVPDAARVVDVGSGAGLPGIPLAIARPDLAVTLLEPMQRRARFLQEVLALLEVDAEVLPARAQDAPHGRWDVAVARAVAPLLELVPMCLPLVAGGGSLLAVKGDRAEAELEEAREVVDAADLEVSLDWYGDGDHTTRVVRLRRPGATGVGTP